MSAAVLIDRLDGVRSTGHGRWIAKCPGHADGSPSLSIRELADGRVLVHDFAGCEVEAVLTAVGLDFGHLFPPRDAFDPASRHERRARPAFDAVAAIHAMAHETAVIAFIAEELATGSPHTARLLLAAGRLHRALDAVGEPRVVPELKRIRAGMVPS